MATCKCVMASIVAISGIILLCAQSRANELPPNVPVPEPVSFQMPVVHQLSNGLRMVLIERHDVPIVRIYGVVHVGAEADPAELSGLASMVAGLLPEGTRHRTAYQVAGSIDRAGGSIDTGAGWDESYANVSVLSDHKQLAFKLIADLLIHPAFRVSEVQRLRRQTLSALDVVDEDPGYVADMVLRRFLFAGTRYAHSEDGTPESIRHITRKDLVNFHERYYVPSRTTIAVVGDITAPDCLALVAKYLGKWKNAPAENAQPRLQPQLPHTREVVVINKPDAVQTEIRVANLGISRSSPDFVALSVANQVLGGPAANRLFDVLRTEHGLAYGASSDLDCYSTLGAWVAKSSTRSATTIKAVEMILRQIVRIRSHRISQWELRNARDYLVGHEALQFESASKVANQVLEMLLYHLPPGYWSQFSEQVRSLTAQQVLAATQKYLNPDHEVIVLVGNVAAFRGGLKKLGAVRVIPIADVSHAYPEPQKGAAAADHPAP